MPDDSDDVRRSVTHMIGESLDALSVGELAKRIGLLRSEIIRLEAALAVKKEAVMQADAFFKT